MMKNSTLVDASAIQSLRNLKLAFISLLKNNSSFDDQNLSLATSVSMKPVLKVVFRKMYDVTIYYISYIYSLVQLCFRSGLLTRFGPFSCVTDRKGKPMFDSYILGNDKAFVSPGGFY